MELTMVGLQKLFYWLFMGMMLGILFILIKVFLIEIVQECRDLLREIKTGEKEYLEKDKVYELMERNHNKIYLNSKNRDTYIKMDKVYVEDIDMGDNLNHYKYDLSLVLKGNKVSIMKDNKLATGTDENVYKIRNTKIKINEPYKKEIERVFKREYRIKKQEKREYERKEKKRLKKEQREFKREVRGRGENLMPVDIKNPYKKEIEKVFKAEYKQIGKDTRKRNKKKRMKEEENRFKEIMRGG